MLVKNLLKQTDQLLTFNSTLDKKYEFQLLLSNLLNKNIIEIIINHELKITEKKKKKFLKKIYFRNLGKPLSKIMGEKDELKFSLISEMNPTSPFTIEFN